MTVTWLVAGRTGPNAARIMTKVHDMWVNSLAALLGALAAIQSNILPPRSSRLARSRGKYQPWRFPAVLPVVQGRRLMEFAVEVLVALL